MNYGVIIIIVLLAVVLIIFLFLKNQKDKKDIVEKLNKDYPHRDDKEGDIEIEDSPKT